MNVPPTCLGAIALPDAPPVTRATAIPISRPKLPALGLLALGVVLTVGPIVGGLFAQVAAGNQLIDEFAPHLEADALSRYDTDLALLRRGAAGVDEVYERQDLPDGRFPGLDEYRQRSSEIDGRATTLLDRVAGAEPDYRRVAAIGGFDRIPFLIVASGIVAIYGSCVLLAGRRDRARSAVAMVVLASAALALYPFLSDLHSGARAGERMVSALAPVMRPDEVRQLQQDFVVIVQAVGELDTGFRQVPQIGRAAADITALVAAWPRTSSDLASLVGVINDNIDNYRALEDLNGFPRAVGLSGLAAFPWLLVGVGATCAGLAVAALPRRRKEAA